MQLVVGVGKTHIQLQWYTLNMHAKQIYLVVSSIYIKEALNIALKQLYNMCNNH